MLALLLVALFAAPSDTTTSLASCDRLYEQVREASATAPVAARAAYLRQAEAARRCYEAHGEAGQTRALQRYVDEVYARFLLNGRIDALEHTERFFARPASVLRTAEDSSWVAKLYEWLGYLYYFQDALTETASAYMTALALSPPEVTINRSRLIQSTGTVLQRLQDFRAARRYYEQADALLAQVDEQEPDWRAQRARWHFLQSDLLLEETDFQGAIDTASYAEAARHARTSYAMNRGLGDASEATKALINLAEATSFIGDTDEAERLLHRALATIPRTDREALLALVYLKLGRLYQQTGVYDEAEAALHEALRYARAADQTPRIRRSLQALGLLNEMQGRHDRATAFYRESIAVLQKSQESLRATDWSALAFGRSQAAYRGLVRVLLAQGYVEEAFLTLERSRARHLQDLRVQARLRAERSPRERARFDSLTTALVEARNGLAADTLDATRRALLQAEEQRLMAERALLLNIDTPYAAVPVDTLQRRLAATGQVILSYFIDDVGISDVLFGRTPRSYVFVVTPDTLAAVPLNISDLSLRDGLAAVSPLVVDTDTTPDYNARQFSRQALFALYERLFAPAALLVRSDARLLIIPDGALFMLPFGMLITAPPPASGAASFLIERHPVTVDLAAALAMVAAPASDSTTVDVTVLGKTTFEDVRRSAPAALQSAGPFVDLPAVRDEIGLLRRRFSGARVFLDDEATEEAFLDTAPSARVVHLASHTVISPSDPLHNAILLSPASENAAHDGTLYLHEIQRSLVPARLVVLSGCSTARGALYPGEGMAGLQYAFRAVGAQSLLATSWFVDDAATARLMDVFYAGLQDGLPKDVALQQAQRAYLAEAVDDVLRSPFFWAAPVLYGNPQPLDFDANVAGRLLLAGLLSLAAVLLAILTVRRLHASRSS